VTRDAFHAGNNPATMDKKMEITKTLAMSAGM
jgi:hypothetical protein